MRQNIKFKTWLNQQFGQWYSYFPMCIFQINYKTMSSQASYATHYIILEVCYRRNG